MNYIQLLVTSGASLAVLGVTCAVIMCARGLAFALNPEGVAGAVFKTFVVLACIGTLCLVFGIIAHLWDR